MLVSMKRSQNLNLCTFVLWICITWSVTKAVLVEKERKSKMKKYHDDFVEEEDKNLADSFPLSFYKKKEHDKYLMRHTRQFFKNVTPNIQLKLNWAKRQVKRKKRIARFHSTIERNLNYADDYSIQHNVRASANIGSNDDCSGDQLINYLARLQVINPESIVNLASSSHLDALCNNVKSSLADTDAYLKTCELREQKDLYLKLINGVRTLSEKVCNDQKFKKAFIKHAQCFSKIRSEYKDCTGPYDWIENPDPIEVCRTYDGIVNCYFNKTTSGCGKDAAIIMNSLMQQIVNSVITVDCLNSTHFTIHQGIVASNASILWTNYLYCSVMLFLFPILVLFI